MNTLKWRNIVTKSLLRTFTTNATWTGMRLESLTPTRSLIRIHGEQVQPFLQTLITNDINHVSKDGPNDCMFTMFLNKTGRILYDAIIYRTTEINTFLIECDKRIDIDLRKHMLMFKIRKKIDIDIVNDAYRLWTVFKPDGNSADDQKFQEIPVKYGALSCYTDPRLKLLGQRIIASADNSATDIEVALPGIKEELNGEFNYAKHRYRIGIGEGIYELPIEKCFPFEANCDYMHGISFFKGCYLGQEFTARTYYTGVIRKRLMPIKLELSISTTKRHEDLLATQITGDNNVALGKLRGVEGDAALGLLRIEPALKSSSLNLCGLKGTIEKPKWWPTEAPRQTKL